MPKIEKEIIIEKEQGLHARPAALFVQTAAKYDAEIVVKKDGMTVSGKSIMGILMLGAAKGSKITIAADGDDAQDAVNDLEEFMSKNE